MEKKYYEKLRKIDSDPVLDALKKIAMDINKNSLSHIEALVIAYMIKEIQDNGIRASDFDGYLKVSSLSDLAKEVLKSHLKDNWEIVLKGLNILSSEELESFILFGESIEEKNYGYMGTPKSVSRLACEILNFSDEDRVLELCSGKGNFLVEAVGFNPKLQYKGIELNYSVKDSAILRAELLGADATFVLYDALEYKDENKFDKLFSNYPFMMRGMGIKKSREDLPKTFDIPFEIIQKCSSDWLFNTLLVEQMNDDGKAVAIMTNGSSWNRLDQPIRQYFVENGLVEAVISLPEKIFDQTAISTVMIVFSKNNDKIRMIDAHEICVRDRKASYFSNENIEEMKRLLFENSEVSIEVGRAQVSKNEYILNATRYFQKAPKIENGIEFEKVIKNIIRGSQIKIGELEKLKSEEPTNYQYFMLSNINSGLISYGEDHQFLRELPRNMEKYCIKDNSIVLSKIGIPNFKSAIAQVDADKKLLANGNVFIIEIDEEKADPYYIQAFFTSEMGQACLRYIHSGAKVPTISVEKLRKMIIPLPSIEKQKELAQKYLASIDELSLLNRKIEKVKEKMKYIVREEELIC